MSCTDCDFKQNQIGAILVIELFQVVNGVPEPFDVSVNTRLDVFVKKADGSTMTFTAAFAAVADGGLGDGTDGKIKITTTDAGDWSVGGDYEAEPDIAETTTGFDGRTGRVYFSVEEILS